MEPGCFFSRNFVLVNFLLPAHTVPPQDTVGWLFAIMQLKAAVISGYSLSLFVVEVWKFGNTEKLMELSPPFHSVLLKL